MSQNNHPSDTSPGESPDWETLARYLAGESPAGERARVEVWLASDRDEQHKWTMLESALATLPGSVAAGIDVEGALAAVKGRRAEATRHLFLEPARSSPERSGVRTTWRVPVPAIAAAAVLAIGAATWLTLDPFSQSPEAPTVMALSTDVGVLDSLTLPDGSRVVLGPVSSIALRGGYGTTSRDVEVTGDAWFDVSHQSEAPFTVHAGNATIVDIGTRFAVRNRPGSEVSVAVTDGSVSFRHVNAPPADGVILKAGDRALLERDGRVVAEQGAATEQDVAWREGRLVFRDAPVAEVVESLQRWYGLNVRVVEPSLAGRRITATFDGDSPETVIRILGLALGGDVERIGDSVVIRPGAEATAR